MADFFLNTYFHVSSLRYIIFGFLVNTIEHKYFGLDEPRSTDWNNRKPKRVNRLWLHYLTGDGGQSWFQNDHLFIFFLYKLACYSVCYLCFVFHFYYSSTAFSSLWYVIICYNTIWGICYDIICLSGLHNWYGKYMSSLQK